MLSDTSAFAQSVDLAMLVIVGISIFLLLVITVAMIYFVIRYSRKRNPVPTQIHGNILLEVVWIVIPTILVMVMFWYGFVGFKELRARTDEAQTVKVYGYMWGWNFEYENGKKTDTLYIPSGSLTKLEMTSRDVNHSFYIPAFRIKEDVIGGRINKIFLDPQKTGSFYVACAEYCGLNHSYMYTKLHVLEPEEFEAWLKEGMEQEQKEEIQEENPVVEETEEESEEVVEKK